MDVFSKAERNIYIGSLAEAKMRKGPPQLLTQLYANILSNLKVPKGFDVFYSNSSITIRPLKKTLPSVKCSEVRSRILINYDYGSHRDPKSIKFYESVRTSVDRLQYLLDMHTDDDKSKICNFVNSECKDNIGALNEKSEMANQGIESI